MLCWAVILLGILCHLGAGHRTYLQSTQVLESEFNKKYSGRTPENATLVVYRYHVQEGSVVRVRISSNDSTRSSPLLAVFRDRATIISSQLPIVINNYMYSETARTLCPFDPVRNFTGNLTFTVELSSYLPVNYEFIAFKLDNFRLKMGEMVQSSASASRPIYFEFEFPEHLDAVVVEIESNSSNCMIINIQRAECPVFDLQNNMISGGMRQTMTKAGSMTVERRFYKKFYIVFVIPPNNDDCSLIREVAPYFPKPGRVVQKNFTIRLTNSPNRDEYIVPITVTFGSIIIIYVLTFIFVLSMGRYEGNRIQEEGRALLPSDPDNDDGDDIATIAVDEAGPSVEHNDSGSDFEAILGTYDQVPDHRDMMVVRMNLHLVVSDLSLKTWKQRERKYHRYIVSLLTIACFYGLPVVQLFLTWQTTVRTSGNLDLCYYNFRCARPFYGFFAFNNLISNSGYMMLGILLMIIVKEREVQYRRIWKAFPIEQQNYYGLPQHNGLMYAIGFAIVMEGVLSASYHICPSPSNYQFDTSFMYIIGMLGMLKVYQLRHPDVYANAHVAFAVSAFFIFIAMVGVFLNNLFFWIFFTVVYLLTMFIVSIEFYFKGLWRFNIAEMLRSVHHAFLSSRKCSCIVPTFKGRFIFILLGNIINMVVVVLGVTNRPKDFPSFLLFPFVANLFLYLLYYIVMKYVHGEKLRCRAIVYLFLTFCCWGGSMWFFWHHVTDWSVTPATSREFNSGCVLLGFYDNHDVWHFLSSIAIFTSFSLLNCVDDDLIWVRRDTIAVF